MILGIDPKVDYAFKRLFGREQNVALLISLLNAVLQLPPGFEVVAVELLNPFQEKDLEGDKLTVLDIKARDSAGRLFNVEMQLLVVAAFRARVLYYWARLHQSHLGEGDDYSALRPTVSIVFINETLLPDVPHWHSVFELRERHSGLLFSDQLQLHVLEVPKFGLSADELRTPLECWLYFLKHGPELDTERVPSALQGPVYRRALEEMQHMTQTDLERERYESRLKAQRDLATMQREMANAQRETANAQRETGNAQRDLATAQREAATARSEGLAVGELIGQIHLCQRLLGRPLTAAEQLRALPLDELKRLAHELEAEAARGYTTRP